MLGRREQRRAAARVAAATAAVFAIAGCFSSSGPDYSGAAPCSPPSNGSSAVSCAVVTGTVVDVDGKPMDGVSGSVRFQPACDCVSPVITVDAAGIFSATLYRVRPQASGLDTATGTVVLFASDQKYPRHFTGGFYYDTARVALTFRPIGTPPVTIAAQLHMPIPAVPGRP